MERLNVAAALQRLEEIERETCNTEFRLSYGRGVWKMYLVKTRTLFTGTLEEVLNEAIDDFLMYRGPSGMNERHKFYKEYSYS